MENNAEFVFKKHSQVSSERKHVFHVVHVFHAAMIRKGSVQPQNK